MGLVPALQHGGWAPRRVNERECPAGMPAAPKRLGRGRAAAPEITSMPRANEAGSGIDHIVFLFLAFLAAACFALQSL